MNILSFDIEEWYIEKMFRSGEQWKYDAYYSMLDRVLELLESHNVKATFFCLGGLVEHFPDVIKKIASSGHEIGCHSMRHDWINKLTRKVFLEDTRAALEALEDCSGRKVTSFRAPAFSIGSSNKWAFEVLATCGFKNDASIFPGARDFGGFPEFPAETGPAVVRYGETEISEFPITLTRLPLLGKQLAYSGGGYFRLLPLGFVKNRMSSADYNMCYFHIADLVDFKSPFMSRAEFERYFKTAGSIKNRILRYAKSNIGRKRAFAGLSALLDTYEFISVEKASRHKQEFPVIKI